jgi:hypothetical protein
MTITSINKLLRLGMLALLAGGLRTADAQPSTPGSTQEAAGTTATAIGSAAPEQMRTQAQLLLPQMEQSAQTVRRQLSQSRESRDVVKVLCLNDKLNQIDVATRAAKDRMPVLMAALDRGNNEDARHEYAVLQILRDRVRALMQEANQCIGEEAGFVGESKVTMTIDHALPSADTTEWPVEPVQVIAIPQPASGNQ